MDFLYCRATHQYPSNSDVSCVVTVCHMSARIMKCKNTGKLDGWSPRGRFSSAKLCISKFEKMIQKTWHKSKNAWSFVHSVRRLSLQIAFIKHEAISNCLVVWPVPDSQSCRLKNLHFLALTLLRCLLGGLAHLKRVQNASLSSSEISQRLL